MNTFGKLLVAISPIFLFIGILLAQPGFGPQPDAKPGAKSVWVKENQFRKRGGEYKQVQANRLAKFDKPRPQPHKDRPVGKKGGNWHWHQYHGWVWLTNVGNVPEVLPLNYILPPMVLTYQLPDLAVQVPTIICPHCGKEIAIHIDP